MVFLYERCGVINSLQTDVLIRWNPLWTQLGFI